MANENSSTSYGLLGIVGMIIGFAVLFLLLNFFNIISLSQLYPNQLGFLPHISSTTNQSTQPTTQKITFACPVAKEFCKSGKEIYDGGQFLGIGYNLPVSSKIYAVISGPAVFGGAEDKSKGILSHAKIVIGGIDEAQGYTVTYDYFGLPTDKNAETKNVSKGENLSALWGGSFPKNSPFNGINVLVNIRIGKNQDIHVSQFE